MLQCISNSSIVICSRFHATILGILAGKPVIPIVYSDKTIHMLNDIGFKGLVIDIRNLNSSYYPQDFDLEKQRFFGCNALNRESQKQFWGLDKILL